MPGFILKAESILHSGSCIRKLQCLLLLELTIYHCLSLSCSYNKVEDDFTTLSEYNDYLEDVESISK